MPRSSTLVLPGTLVDLYLADVQANLKRQTAKSPDYPRAMTMTSLCNLHLSVGIRNVRFKGHSVPSEPSRINSDYFALVKSQALPNGKGKVQSRRCSLISIGQSHPDLRREKLALSSAFVSLNSFTPRFHPTCYSANERFWIKVPVSGGHQYSKPCT